MELEIVPVQKTQTPLRIAIEGASGTGKTYSALLMALGVCGDMAKVVVINTQDHGASLYSHLGPFSTIQIGPPFHTPKFNDALTLCESVGAEVIIVDDISSAWNGEGGVVDKLKGDSYETALRSHRSFLFYLRHSTCHIICTIRTRSKIVQVEHRGRWLRRLVQMPVQQDNIETYFNTVLRLDRKHRAAIIKDCTQTLSDIDRVPITPSTGAMLLGWYKGTDPRLSEELHHEVDGCRAAPGVNQHCSHPYQEGMEPTSLFTQRRLELEYEEDASLPLGKGIGGLQLIRGGMA